MQNCPHKDFDIQTDHLILARWPYPMIVDKKKKKNENLPNSWRCRIGRPQSKNKKVKRDIDTKTLPEN